MTLEEYAKQHPIAEPEKDKQKREQRTQEREKKEQTQKSIEEIKEGITAQIAQGIEPQYILYSSLKAIGILSNDQEWSDKNTAAIDKVYGDLAQQSFIFDNTTVAQQRLAVMRDEYITKVKKQLERQLYNYKRLERALTEAVRVVNSIQETGGTDGQ